MAAALKVLTVAPRAKHTATIIFVHGLGDSGFGWKPVADMFASEMPHVKWIMPHAPKIQITANGGMLMPGWFDVFEFGSINAREDEAGILKTAHALNQLITAEVDAGIPADRIVLGGFSQGAAMSLFTGLTTERRLAGVAVLSGWLGLRNKVKVMLNDHAKKLPVFWGHGKSDQIVRFDRATASIEFIKGELGLKTLVSPDKVLEGGIEWHAYDMLAHSANDQELQDLKTFLQKVLPAQE
ncbi:Phospholipase/carboxylesterase [Trametes versicolor FP-101664 SS1]|uniref:Phospholipase/carboxylesterase n=1 Tax=Trametes versicolor (strain FP-101664) TaxID=717944 RepID=UPI00046227B5|nr:Phospholipase/carboxylesterase [Trametes versicolor FP-101664 SS1]EIW61403.1 Phospholipase/carboxylesterase [Trametes versicolor FP-101664 SS1]